MTLKEFLKICYRANMHFHTVDVYIDDKRVGYTSVDMLIYEGYGDYIIKEIDTDEDVLFLESQQITVKDFLSKLTYINMLWDVKVYIDDTETGNYTYWNILQQYAYYYVTYFDDDKICLKSR